MKRVTRAMSMSLIGLSLLAGSVYADDAKTGANDGGQTTLKPAATPSALETVKIAGDLASWARNNKDPVALASAARLLGSIPPTQEMKDPKKQADGDQKADKDAPKAKDFTPAALIAEARELAAGNKEALAVIDSIEKTIPTARGGVKGPVTDKDTLPPGGAMTYAIAFKGGEPMQVAVFADNGASISIQVFDESGNVMPWYYDDHFEITPKWTGPFKIVLTNNTNGYVPYTLATN